MQEILRCTGKARAIEDWHKPADEVPCFWVPVDWDLYELRESFREARDRAPAVEGGTADGSERARLEFSWLAENRERHAGRWVALEGDNLLAVADSAREVYAAVVGYAGTPLVTLIEPEDERCFAGW